MLSREILSSASGGCLHSDEYFSTKIASGGKHNNVNSGSYIEFKIFDVTQDKEAKKKAYEEFLSYLKENKIELGSNQIRHVDVTRRDVEPGLFGKPYIIVRETINGEVLE
jgi:hypothetical protein